MLIRAPLAARGDDLYETPPEATEALLRVENLPRSIWEPACGPGAIARVLRGAGHHVVATDLTDYGTADQDHAGWDFLLEHKLPDGVEAICTNPPFKLAGEFVAHALRLCPRVVMLLRLTFLESTGRTPILDNGHLARVHVFKNRLPMMHRDGWDGNRVSNPTAFGWFVWDRNHRGPTTLHRISWTPIGAQPLPARDTGFDVGSKQWSRENDENRSAWTGIREALRVARRYGCPGRRGFRLYRSLVNAGSEA